MQRCILIIVEFKQIDKTLFIKTKIKIEKNILHLILNITATDNLFVVEILIQPHPYSIVKPTSYYYHNSQSSNVKTN